MHLRRSMSLPGIMLSLAQLLNEQQSWQQCERVSARRLRIVAAVLICYALPGLKMHFSHKENNFKVHNLLDVDEARSVHHPGLESSPSWAAVACSYSFSLTP
eukprot:2906794-Amphidinium_carterae.1